ncbi:hypothetical protein [Treponema bryantii]|uniref:hypothetical protein n=1 Tax=Treponema bryantii TaxID=163 RepID=UPI0003B524A3|nr:hypothetical protein [Treponema bryantii]
MKKINLILSACAIAAVALLVSCNNGTKDYVNVRTINNSYAYNVTGSVTNTKKDGNTTAASVNVTTATIKSATAKVEWSEDKLNDSNYDYYTVKFNGTANWTTSNTPAGSTTATTSKFTDEFGVEGTTVEQERVELPAGWYSPTFITQIDSIYNHNYENNPLDYYEYLALQQAFVTNYVDDATKQADTTGSYDSYTSYSSRVRYFYVEEPCIDSLELSFYEFDGDFYVWYDNEYVKLPEDAVDGDFGDDEITIKYTLSDADTRTGLSETEKNDTTVVQSTETAYNFTFKLVEAE